ncbi:MAG: S1C family serine protease [Planctomycetota bacterium]
MRSSCDHRTRRRVAVLVLISGLFVLGGSRVNGDGDDLSKPKSLEELKRLQLAIAQVVEKAQVATVGVIASGSRGSGIIISADGLVLTAAHVVATHGAEATLYLADGRRVRAKTTAINSDRDSAILRITEPGEWPFLPMGNSNALRNGDWCVAFGHAGGFQRGTPAAVRLGRVLSHDGTTIRTDCPIVNGDSGGPLISLDARVVGIHSRIHPRLSANYHVPVNVFRPGPFLGVRGRTYNGACEVTEVISGQPAEKSGIKVGDLVVAIDGDPVTSIGDLIEVIGRQDLRATVRLAILRGAARERIEIPVVLCERPLEMM